MISASCRILIIFILIFVTYKDILAEQQVLEFGHRIGVISVFPGKSGLFFDDRMYGKNTNRIFGRDTSLFPANHVLFHTDVNSLIVSSLVHALKNHFKSKHKFIALPSLDTERHLTGYMINGTHGSESDMVTVKGLYKFFQQERLDTIIAITPVTYHVPRHDEGSGIELRLSSNEISFSCCYAVLVFSKYSGSYRKRYGSIKQVYTTSSAHKFTGQLIRHYNQECVEQYYLLLQENFIPYLMKQLTALIAERDVATVFPKPRKPFVYYAK